MAFHLTTTKREKNMVFSMANALREFNIEHLTHDSLSFSIRTLDHLKLQPFIAFGSIE